MTRIDFLFIRRMGVSGEAFCPPKPSFRLPLLGIAIAAICSGWYLFAAERNADFRDDFETTPLSADERIRWSYFHEEVDEASQVQTLDDAFPALMGIRHSVNYLPYKDDRHRRDANCCLDTAENHLSTCHVQRRDHPSYWRAELTKALREIPKEAGRLDETPPPPTIDGE